MDLETGKLVLRDLDAKPGAEIEVPQETGRKVTEPEPPAAAKPEKEEVKPEQRPSETEEEEEPETEVRIPGFFRFVIRLAVFAVILYGLFSYVLGIFSSYDDRMYPFIMDGDIIITNRLASYGVGDAVLYENPDTGNTAVSRIAAAGANTVDITGDGEVLISGNPSGLTVYETTPQAHTGTMTYPYTMSEGGYFLLNDHRAVEIDSRQFGEIRKDVLLGKVILVIRWKGF